MGSPFSIGGMSQASSLSRTPANITIASIKPAPAPNAFTRADTYVYDGSAPAFSITSIVTPSTAQFVVISGRHIPKESYKGGIYFFSAVSTSCTSPAIIKINTIVSKYSSPFGTNRHWYTGQVTAVASTITNITALLIPTAVFNFLETPKNGHIPKNLHKT